MPHEQSETVQGPDGRWYNIHGRTRKRLPQLFPFEQPSYVSMEEAVEAARQRSEFIGQIERFTEGLRGPLFPGLQTRPLRPPVMTDIEGTAPQLLRFQEFLRQAAPKVEQGLQATPREINRVDELLRMRGVPLLIPPG